MHEIMAPTRDRAVEEIRGIQESAKSGGTAVRPKWPMIVLRTPKGWTCPKVIDGKRVEGSWRSHQVPMGAMQENTAHVALLETWMKSYRPEELFDDRGALVSELQAL